MTLPALATPLSCLNDTALPSQSRCPAGKTAEARKLAALGLSHLTLPPQPSNYISDFPQPQAPAAKGQEGGADFPGPLGGGGGGGIPALLHASHAKVPAAESPAAA